VVDDALADKALLLEVLAMAGASSVSASHDRCRRAWSPRPQQTRYSYNDHRGLGGR
jgi:hypothetical protein